MSGRDPAVVIGAGHNGLVTAARLAKAGLRVIVLERRGQIGGAATTEEFHPGFRCDTGAHRLGGLRPEVVRELKLARHGLRLVRPDPTLFAPLPDGRYLLLRRDPVDTATSIRAIAPADAARWPEFSARMAAIVGFLEKLHAIAPPRVLAGDRSDVLKMLKLGARLRLAGRETMIDVLRTLPMSVAELVDEWFESEPLKGVLAAGGVDGLDHGPRAAGTAHLLLHHHAWTDGASPRSPSFVQGGMVALADALAAAARAAGAELRTGVEVAAIRVRDGRATGVRLTDGTAIDANRVASSADPQRTFLELLDPAALEAGFLRAVRNIRYRGACAKVHLALGDLPRFTAAPYDDGDAHLHGLISISPDLEYLERAHDDAKYGEPSHRPYLEAVIPTLHSPSLAPAGKHVMSIRVQYAPYRLKDRDWDDAGRDELGDRVVRTLADYAPDLPGLIEAREVLTPVDLERRFGLTQGNIDHGAMTLDQLFLMRPVPGWARYRTPIEGLYLCGAGAHPGGGVTGSPGYNSAAEILRDLKRP